MFVVRAMKRILILTGILMLGPTLASAQTTEAREADDTEICENLETGSTKEMSLGPACDAEPYGNAKRALRLYGDYIFNVQERARRPTYFRRYTSRIFTLAQTASAHLFKQRSPQASTAEAHAFNKAFLALLGQENRYLHYRWGLKNPNDLKFQVGDRDGSTGIFNARGITQVNVRFHHVGSETLFDLSKNLTYASGYFYSFWNSAKNTSCVRDLPAGSPEYWEALSIATYASYNRNLGSACRSFGANGFHVADTGYRNHLIELEENPLKSAALARGLTTPPLVDYISILNGADFATKTAEDIDFHRHKVAYLDSGKVCRVENGGLFCLDEKDEACLDPETRHHLHEGRYVFARSSLYRVADEDRNKVCGRSIPELHPIGSIIELKKSGVVLRDEAGADLGWRVPQGYYQVLDFRVEAKNDTNVVRKYKIVYNGQAGFIHGGESPPDAVSDDLSHWTTLALPHGRHISLRAHDFVRRFGLVDVQIPFAGSIVTLQPRTSRETTVQVKAVNIDGNGQRIHVTYDTEKGEVSVYIGDSGPTETVLKNIRVVSL